MITAIVRMLVDNAHWSNAAVARYVGCDERRVGRCRRRIAHSSLTPEELKAADAAQLRRLLHARKAQPFPNFAALTRDNPCASNRALWRAYIVDEIASGWAGMSYANFNRRMAEWRLL